MEQVRVVLRKTCAILIIGLLMLGCIPFTALGGSRTGTTGNEPATGFSEGTEKVEIYHQDLSHNTNFNLGETVYIRITTSQITTASGSNNNNIVRIFRNTGAQVGADHNAFFTKVGTGGPPYVFEGSFVADAGNGFTVSDNYLLYMNLKQQGGNPRVTFWDVIHVGAANPEEKSIKIYSDAAYTTEAYQFPPTSKLYLAVWSGNNVADTLASSTVLRTYPGITVQTQVMNLANPTLTKVGNYTRFIYDLSVDPGTTITLVNKYWYTLSVTLNDGTTNLVADWSVQFMVNTTLANPPVLVQGTTTANPASITVGQDTTTISTPFTHADMPGADLFKITYKVRDASNNEITIANNATNGFGHVTVVQDSVDKTKYTASVTWTPNAQTPVGLYDLYFYVNDTVNKAEDAYVNNLDELELKPPPAVPIIVAGSTKATPPVVQAPGSYSTVISVNFTHADGPAADSFKITFRVRDPGNTILTALVNNVQSGVGGLLVVKTGTTTYTANFSWNPDDAAVTGPYDLYSRVEDANGAFAEDYFSANLDKLVLTKPAALPVVVAGATRATPVSVNITETTVLTTEFEDNDMPSITTFTVMYVVRDESNKTYTLVNDMHHGYGGLSIMDMGTGNYRASFSWVVPNTQPLGKYDLYFKVTNANYLSAIDDFVSNNDELTITKKPSPPVMAAGATTATPNRVNVEGTDTTTLKTTFSHPDKPSVTTLKITFKVRDIGNQEYTLVASGTSGSPATLTVTGDSKGNYTAQFVWDPPSVGQPLGSYALYSSIEDANSQKVQDAFANNLDKLMLIKETPQGNGTISGYVKDTKGKPIANSTVKVYNSTTHVVVATLTTKADGSYTTQVPMGLYDVGTEADGYKGEVQANLLVKKGTPLSVPDFKLIKTKGSTSPGTGSIPTYIFGLIVLLLVIIVILCLFLAMKMGGKGSGVGMEPRGPVHRHEMKDEGIESDHPIEPREEHEMETEPKPIPKEKIKIEKLKDDDKE